MFIVAVDAASNAYNLTIDLLSGDAAIDWGAVLTCQMTNGASAHSAERCRLELACVAKYTSFLQKSCGLQLLDNLNASLNTRTSTNDWISHQAICTYVGPVGSSA
jgi:hypothetical protein